MSKSLSVILLSGAVAAAPAAATYTSIGHGGLGPTNTSATYDAQSGVLSLSGSSDSLSLNDPTQIPGLSTDVDMQLTTTLQSFNAQLSEATFSGGMFDLTFLHGGQPYFIRGPIAEATVRLQFSNPLVSLLDVDGLFTAFFDLPGSNDWPAGAGLSRITSMTVALLTDLEDFAWDEDLSGGGVEKRYLLFPIPEPSTLAMICLLTPLIAMRRSSTRY